MTFLALIILHILFNSYPSSSPLIFFLISSDQQIIVTKQLNWVQMLYRTLDSKWLTTNPVIQRLIRTMLNLSQQQTSSGCLVFLLIKIILLKCFNTQA